MKHRMSAWRKLAAAALSALLALNLAYPAVPAFAEEGDPAPAAEEQEPQSTNIKAQSDEAENTDSTPVEKISVSVAVIGPDTDGNDVYWLQPTYVTVNKGDFAWAAVKPALDGSGLTWSWSDGSWGISFNSITSPFTFSASSL